MDPLADQTCTTCSPETRRANAADMAELLPAIPGWEVREHFGVPKLIRRFPVPDFRTAMTFANRVAALAEEHGHHPVMRIGPEHVIVRWWTHSIAGLHRNDFVMAAKTSATWDGLASAGD